MAAEVRVIGGGERKQRDPSARPGDKVRCAGVDYPVVSVAHQPRRLLLRDPDGSMFVIRAYRLDGKVWTLVPAERKAKYRDRGRREWRERRAA